MARIFDSDGSCGGTDSTRPGFPQYNEDGGRQHREVSNYTSHQLALPAIPQHPQSSNWNGQSATAEQRQFLRMYETWTNNVDPK
jgi:hypothetical protein